TPGTAPRPPASRRRPRPARPSRGRSCGSPRSAPELRGSSTSTDSSEASCGRPALYAPPSRVILGWQPAMSETVLLERDGERAATITLTRPERLNTIVPELIEDFLAALREAQADPDVRAIRLKGAGRVFCAGYDIGWGSEMMEGQPDPWDPILDYQVM